MLSQALHLFFDTVPPVIVKVPELDIPPPPPCCGPCPFALIKPLLMFSSTCPLDIFTVPCKIAIPPPVILQVLLFIDPPVIVKVLLEDCQQTPPPLCDAVLPLITPPAIFVLHAEKTPPPFDSEDLLFVIRPP